jgi:hypothetical protein
MRSRIRSHRHAQEGGDRGDQNRRADSRGHTMSGDHCFGGFFRSAGWSVGLPAGLSFG